MRKLTSSVVEDLSVISNIIVIEIKYIPKTKLSKTFSTTCLRGVTFKILDLEGHKYEEVDYFSC